MSVAEDFSFLVGQLTPADTAARERVISAALGRLERLTRKMLRRFPGVGRWEQTEDVLQNALLRLDRALRAVTPATSREFFALAAEMIRRELIDLARKHGGAHGVGANHDTGHFVGDPANAGLDPSTPTDEPDALEKWSAFHEAVEHLPAAEREVFMLAFYHKWKHSDIAELFQVDERTVRRRWAAAVDALADRLGGDVPDG